MITQIFFRVKSFSVPHLPKVCYDKGNAEFYGQNNKKIHVQELDI